VWISESTNSDRGFAASALMANPLKRWAGFGLVQRPNPGFRRLAQRLSAIVEHPGEAASYIALLQRRLSRTHELR
jgi:hypothetical protein